MKIDIVIPAYNEEKKIVDTLNSLSILDRDIRVIVVDDKSTDSTLKLIENFGMENLDIISLDKNVGKGNAIKEGIKRANSDIICLLDADLGCTAIEVEKLINPILNSNIDFTIAKFGKARKKGGFGLVKKLARWAVKHYTNKEIISVLSGQRAYKKEVLDSIKYIPDDFGMEVAMTVQAINSGYKFKEVEVNMTHSESGRDLNGFIHRGRQFKDILKTIINLKKF